MFPLQSYPPMTMVDFFAASRGTWLNRRAVHHLDHQDDEAADSNLVIEPFKNDDPAVRSICEALNINMIDSTGGARFWWESNIKKGVRNEDYAAVVIDVPNRDNARKGFLLRDVGYVEKQAVLSTYVFAEDGVLTITTRYDTNIGIERCWFVTDQIRMRVSSVQCLDGVAMTTYCTEFRCPTDADINAISEHARQIARSTASIGA
ncbi:putative phycoerythrobilin:phycoerythrin lyase CpeU [Synechococcus sp. A18-40]|nr:putative phycoerythrobilin:phycoerythrin lyase CpeU [Synechococcus sp. A18-40]